MKVTDWFRPDVKPTLPGVYEVLGLGDIFYFSKWDGKNWHWGSRDIEEAGRETSIKEQHDYRKWRGLAEKP